MQIPYMNALAKDDFYLILRRLLPASLLPTDLQPANQLPASIPGLLDPLSFYELLERWCDNNSEDDDDDGTQPTDPCGLSEYVDLLSLSKLAQMSGYRAMNLVNKIAAALESLRMFGLDPRIIAIAEKQVFNQANTTGEAHFKVTKYFWVDLTERSRPLLIWLLLGLEGINVLERTQFAEDPYQVFTECTAAPAIVITDDLDSAYAWEDVTPQYLKLDKSFLDLQRPTKPAKEETPMSDMLIQPAP